MSTNCRSCGKMMGKPEDFSGGNVDSQYCANCTNADGSLKSLDEITLNIANQLITSQGIDREAATKAARSILSVQPEWKKKIADHDQRPARRQKILLIGVSVALSIALVASLTYIGIRNKKTNVYGWDQESVTDKKLFTDVKPVITKEDHDGATVTRVSFPNNQYNLKINKFGDQMYFYDRTHDNSGYKLYWKDGKVDGTDLGQVGNDFFFIGSADSTYGDKIYYYLINNSTSTGFDIYASAVLTKEWAQKIGHIALLDEVVMCEKYLAWIQNQGDDPTQQQVYAFNPETWKKYLIDNNLSSKEKIRAGENTVYWLDDYETDKIGQFVKGYDFEKRRIVKTNVPGYTGDVVIVNGLSKIIEKFDVWGVLGDDVVSSDSSNGFTIFDSKSSNIKNIKADNLSDLNEKNVIISNLGNNASSNEVEYNLNDPTDFATSQNCLVWLSKVNGKECVSWRPRPFQDSNKTTNIELHGYSYAYTDLLAISDDWLVWVASTAKDEKQWNEQIEDSKNELPPKNELYATNLKTGKQINLGVYDFSGVENISVTTDKYGLVAWTAWTDDAAYDIFYTKLP